MSSSEIYEILEGLLGQTVQFSDGCRPIKVGILRHRLFEDEEWFKFFIEDPETGAEIDGTRFHETYCEVLAHPVLVEMPIVYNYISSHYH